MRPPDEIRRDLPPDLDPAEREQLVALAQRLEADAPLPAPTFRGDLRRRLMGLAGRRVHGGTAPRPIRALAAAYAASGALLLAVAAVGLASAGPFAPG